MQLHTRIQDFFSGGWSRPDGLQRKLYFSKDPERVQHFPGGVQMLITIETHTSCEFREGVGSGPLSPPPLDPHMSRIAAHVTEKRTDHTRFLRQGTGEFKKINQTPQPSKLTLL